MRQRRENMELCRVSAMGIITLALAMLLSTGGARSEMVEATATATATATAAASVETTAVESGAEEVYDTGFYTEISAPGTCEPCPCVGSTMDCSSQNLRAFLMKTTIANVTNLELGHNRLEELPGDSFIGLPNLKYLTLSDNYIASVDADAFQGLFVLERLDLANNALAKLPATLLRNLTRLQRLYMRRNRLTDVRFLPHTNCSLETVQLSMNALARLPVRSFGNCKGLRELWLDGNKISQVDEDAFDGLINLNTLDLSSNRLSEIPPRTLRTLRALRTLDLSRNQIVFIDGGMFETLTSLRSVYLSFNWLQEIPASTFSTCVSLRRVILSDNLIEYVDEDAFTSTPTQKLPPQRVTHQKCVGLTNRTANVAVKHLDLSHNHLRKIPEGSFLAFPNLEELNLEHNLITTFGEGMVCLAGVLKERLLFSGNRLVCRCGALYEAFRLAERVAPNFQPECLHSGEPWVVLLGKRCREAASAAAAQARILAPGPPQPPEPREPLDNGVHAAVLAPILAVAFVTSLAAMAVSVFRRYHRASYDVPPTDTAGVRMTLYARAPSFTTTASVTTSSEVSRL